MQLSKQKIIPALDAHQYTAACVLSTAESVPANQQLVHQYLLHFAQYVGRTD